MSHHLNDKIWLIGAGPMAIDYARVLSEMSVSFDIIGRGQKSADDFYAKTGKKVFVGGLEKRCIETMELPCAAIVAVGVEQLASVTHLLLRKGVKKILVEKPAGLNENDIKSVFEVAQKLEAGVYVAYNRRFYASTLKAKDLILEDGGVTSFLFEFTEWSHEIIKLEKEPVIRENWFLANSSHVVDLAFYLGGRPKKISSYVLGGSTWHPSGSIYAGAGLSETGALFSYHANWEAPGRWGIEILTKKHRLILRPLEKLQWQKIGNVGIEFVEINDELDKKFKPGLFRQVEAFLSGRADLLLSIKEHVQNLHYYEIIKTSNA